MRELPRALSEQGRKDLLALAREALAAHAVKQAERRRQAAG